MSIGVPAESDQMRMINLDEAHDEQTRSFELNEFYVFINSLKDATVQLDAYENIQTH